MVDGVAKRIGVTRVHMEDDAGKSIHDGFKDSDRYSYVDLNRSGTPLIEIVSEPDMRSADEAYAYLTELKQVHAVHRGLHLRHGKGPSALRRQRVSVRLKGAEKFGTKAEVKNLNSFRFLKQAIDYEIARQVALIESGGAHRAGNAPVQPRSRRDLQHAQQGRRARLPLLPRARPGAAAHQRKVARRSARLHAGAARAQAGALPRRVTDSREYDAEVLTATRAISEYFETVAGVSGNPKMAANWVMGDLMAHAEGRGQGDRRFARSARENLGELVKLIASDELSGKLAKEIFPKMFSTGEPAAVIVEREGLKQITDTGALEKIIDGRDRRQSQTGGAVQRRQDDGDQLPGRPGDEGHARPGQRGRGDGSVQTETGVNAC